MSVSEILKELPKLAIVDRETILYRLLDLESGREDDESPAMLAAVDEGIRSAEAEPLVTLEELEKRLTQWNSE